VITGLLRIQLTELKTPVHRGLEVTVFPGPTTDVLRESSAVSGSEASVNGAWKN